MVIAERRGDLHGSERVWRKIDRPVEDDVDRLGGIPQPREGLAVGAAVFSSRANDHTSYTDGRKRADFLDHQGQFFRRIDEVARARAHHGVDDQTVSERGFGESWGGTEAARCQRAAQFDAIRTARGCSLNPGKVVNADLKKHAFHPSMWLQIGTCLLSWIKSAEKPLRTRLAVICMTTSLVKYWNPMFFIEKNGMD